MQSTMHDADREVAARLTVRGWLAVAAVAMCVYAATAQRTVSWQDSGEFQWRCLTGDLAGTMGIARAHPLYVAVGTVIAKATGPAMPLALNAFSGLGMAIALATFAAVACRVSGSRLAALLTTALLGVCHTAWWLSTIAEVYTWSLAAFLCEIYLLLRLLEKPDWRWLALLALVNGLHLCVHNFALLGLPIHLAVVVMLLVRRRLPARALLPAIPAWLAGAGLYVGMTAHVAIDTGSVVAAIRSALVGDYASQVVNVGGVSKHLKANAALSAMNFINPLLPLAMVGWWRPRSWSGCGAAASIAALTIIHVVFFIRYPVPDQFTFILPSLMLIALAASVGMARLRERGGKWRVAMAAAMLVGVIAQPAVFAAAAESARRSGAAQRQRQLPFRDEARYWLVPWKQNEDSAARFAWAALEQVEPGALIWPESTSVYPLLTFQRLHGLRPDASVQYNGHPLPETTAPDQLADLARHQPLYIVAPSVPERFRTLAVDREGVLYRARGGAAEKPTTEMQRHRE
jgi:hypothetical protein